MEEPQQQTMDSIIADLQGFGIEELDEILTIKIGKASHHLRISNVATEDEVMSVLAAEEFKGHAWIQQVKCEILSRAITYIDGFTLPQLTPQQRIVKHPTKAGVQTDVQVVLRDTLLSWGTELVGILWKVLMVHCQNVEDRLIEAFPESRIATEVERRFLQQALEEIEEINKEAIRDTVEKIQGSADNEAEQGDKQQ